MVPGTEFRIHLARQEAIGGCYRVAMVVGEGLRSQTPGPDKRTQALLESSGLREGLHRSSQILGFAAGSCVTGPPTGLTASKLIASWSPRGSTRPCSSVRSGVRRRDAVLTGGAVVIAAGS